MEEPPAPLPSKPAKLPPCPRPGRLQIAAEAEPARGPIGHRGRLGVGRSPAQTRAPLRRTRDLICQQTWTPRYRQVGLKLYGPDIENASCLVCRRTTSVVSAESAVCNDRTLRALDMECFSLPERSATSALVRRHQPCRGSRYLDVSQGSAMKKAKQAVEPVLRPSRRGSISWKRWRRNRGVSARSSLRSGRTFRGRDLPDAGGAGAPRLCHARSRNGRICADAQIIPDRVAISADGTAAQGRPSGHGATRRPRSTLLPSHRPARRAIHGDRADRAGMADGLVGEGSAAVFPLTQQYASAKVLAAFQLEGRRQELADSHRQPRSHRQQEGAGGIGPDIRRGRQFFQRRRLHPHSRL